MGRKILASIFATAAFCLMACSSNSGTDTPDEGLDDPSLPICQDNPQPDDLDDSVDEDL